MVHARVSKTDRVCNETKRLRKHTLWSWKIFSSSFCPKEYHHEDFSSNIIELDVTRKYLK